MRLLDAPPSLRLPSAGPAAGVQAREGHPCLLAAVLRRAQMGAQFQKNALPPPQKKHPQGGGGGFGPYFLVSSPQQYFAAPFFSFFCTR